MAEADNCEEINFKDRISLFYTIELENGRSFRGGKILTEEDFVVTGSGWHLGCIASWLFIFMVSCAKNGPPFP